MGQIADILFSRGELDEALRIRREEELPVYERLGEVRSRAVTMGQIADIYHSRGELDEALRIHEEERLPIAERLQHIDSLIHILVTTSRIRRQKGIEDQATFERVLTDLVQAHRLAVQYGRLDFISATSMDLGTLLLQGGAKEQAKPLLVQARDGWIKLQQSRAAVEIDEMLKYIDGAVND